MTHKDEVRIGVTWSDTGWCWLDCRVLYTGLRVWVHETNENGGMFVPEAGRRLPVRLISADDESNPEVAIAAVERLVADGIDVLCSSGSAEIQHEVLPITERHRVLNLNVGAPDSQLFALGARFHLQCGPSLGGWLRSRPAFWKEHGLMRVAQLYADVWGWNGVGRPLKGWIEEEGAVELVLHKPIARQERWTTEYGPFRHDFDDWAAVVREIADARPDAVVISLPAPTQYRIMREMRRQGVWFPYLEMMYGPRLAKIGFGPEDLLLQFQGGRTEPGPAAGEITVGGTQEELDHKAQAYLGSTERNVYGRSYVGPALWEHLVLRAGSMEAEAVMEQVAKDSGSIVTMLGRMTWLPSGDTATPDGTTDAVVQIRRHPWSADLHLERVFPAHAATAEPVFTREPYEGRPPPWTSHGTARR